jgi:hypothetical protein
MSAERLAPLAAAALTEDQRQAAAEFREGRGYAVHGPFAVMLRSPEVMLPQRAAEAGERDGDPHHRPRVDAAV